MNGKEILIDTNIIIYLLQGDDTLEGLLQGKQLVVSFITELELMGLPSGTEQQQKQIEDLLNDCQIINISSSIKKQYKLLRKTSKIKLADCIIAATALALELPLMTSDKQFKTIKQLDLLQYEQ